MSISVRREKPPPVARRSHGNLRWDAVFAVVEKGRGEWFRVGEYASQNSATTTANAIGKRLGVRDRFEFAARTIDGKGVLYARLRTEAKG